MISVRQTSSANEAWGSVVFALLERAGRALVAVGTGPGYSLLDRISVRI
jgi:hypothetical protein